MTINIASWRAEKLKKCAWKGDLSSIEINAILCHTLDKSLDWCLRNPHEMISLDDLHRLEEKIDRLLAGEPLAYLTGMQEFYGNKFYVNPEVLIPRPESEMLVDLALSWLSAHPESEIVEVGCGSGAVIISILKQIHTCRGFGLDISLPALRVAKKNCKSHKVKSLNLAQMDALQSLSYRFDLIIANLPYIPTAKLDKLEELKYEPRIALDGGEDGLIVIRKLIQKIPDHIRKPGLIILEIQYDQGKIIQTMLEDLFPYGKVAILKDLANHDRVVKLEI